MYRLEFDKKNDYIAISSRDKGSVPFYENIRRPSITNSLRNYTFSAWISSWIQTSAIKTYGWRVVKREGVNVIRLAFVPTRAPYQAAYRLYFGVVVKTKIDAPRKVARAILSRLGPWPNFSTVYTRKLSSFRAGRTTRFDAGETEESCFPTLRNELFHAFPITRRHLASRLNIVAL